MTTDASRPCPRWLQWVFFISLGLLLLAHEEAVWTDTTLLLPWILALCHAPVRSSLRQIIRRHAILGATSLAFSILIVLGCLEHQCTRLEQHAAFIPVLWIPMAALTYECLKQNARGLVTTIALALATTSLLVIWQRFVQQEDRPPALSYNVLVSPLILALICLLGALTTLTHKSGDLLTFKLSAALGIFAAILTQAKTGLLTFLAGGLMLAACEREHRRLILTWVAAIGICWGIALSEKIKIVRDDVSSYNNQMYKTSVGERTDAIKWAAEHFFDAPLTGKGRLALYAEFNHRWAEWGRQQEAVTLMAHLHNDYLQVALSKGIPALACFVTLWVGVWDN
ncbi:MAG: O-antigen ligase family protein [Aquabacterium sp.]